MNGLQTVFGWEGDGVSEESESRELGDVDDIRELNGLDELNSLDYKRGARSFSHIN